MTRFGDRYGYYQIGDIKTYSRYELMDIHHDKPQSWQWNYNDEFFSRYDWTVEPKESIDELYKKRAEQLRRDYDYLILYYSGGYDSVNMLNAFLDNNIKIDEICTFYSRLDRVSAQFKELDSITWKKLKKLKQTHKDIVFREVDYADYFFKWHENVKALKLDKDAIHMFGISLSLNRLVTDLLFKEINDWKQLLKNKKKIAWLYGVDKPMLRYHNHKWKFNFHDGIIQWNLTPMRQMIDDGNIGTYEFFYWSPQQECAKIIIKQCHLLKKVYDEQAKKDFSKIENFKPFKEGYGWEIDKMSLPFVKTLYPKNFQVEEDFYIKGDLFILGNRDQWFFNSAYPGSQIHWQIYQSILKEDKKHYRQWYNDNTSINSGFRNAISREYVI